jgi:polysaccharide biosynthesis protein PelE
MNALHWAWSAVLVELGLFLSPLIHENSHFALSSVLVLHVLASAIVASGTYVLQPQRFKQPRTMVWLLLFMFAFIAPVVGAVGMLLIIRTTLRTENSTSRQAVPQSVNLPEYDVQSKDVIRSGQGAIRSRLGGNVSGDVRMQSLMTLQAVPSRLANPILEDLLGDSTDDVRLVAFGMLDAEEKKLNGHIQREREQLERDLTPEQRFDCLRHLAELHWELIYASLAQGELRNHILSQAHHYVDEATKVDTPPNSGLLFLYGRILLAQGEIDGAQKALEQSIALGQPLTSTLPYLAEMAYNRRDFASVKQFMAQMAGLNVAPRTRAVADLWTERDKVSNFSDRQYLPHI